jgi:hypothetical protein
MAVNLCSHTQQSLHSSHEGAIARGMQLTIRVEIPGHAAPQHELLQIGRQHQRTNVPPINAIAIQ